MLGLFVMFAAEDTEEAHCGTLPALEQEFGR